MNNAKIIATFVKGKKINVPIEPNTTISELKNKIILLNLMDQNDPNNINLIYLGKYLSDPDQKIVDLMEFVSGQTTLIVSQKRKIEEIEEEKN